MTDIKSTIEDDAVEPTEDIAAELMKIQNKIDLDIAVKKAAKEHGVSVAAIKDEIARRKKKPADVIPMKGRAAPSADELTRSASDIIDADNVLDCFEASWLKVSAGEVKNAKLLLLCGTSRLFGTCMNAAIKGPSSCGKSVLRGRVLDFFPPESVISFTTLSEKALLYYREDFSHKILSMGEAGGAEEQELQDYLLRELMSEGRLVYPVVQKIGDQLETINIEKNGPVAFQVTTTKAALHPENETRMISIDVDDSEGQTALVLGKVAEITGMNAEAATIDFEPWRDFQRWLAAGNCRVVVPFAGRLARLIPPRSVRLRRDFGQILLAIKAHALLHRHRRRADERGQIVADLTDYRVVAELMGGIVSEAAGTHVGKELQETIDAVKDATAVMGPDDGATADKVAKKLHLDKSSAWRRLRVAMNKGFIINLETRRGQPGRYRQSGQEVEVEELLPAVDALVGHEDVVHPSESDATVQPAPRSQQYQGDTGCKAPRNRTQSDPFEAGCELVAWPHATVKSMSHKAESPPVARLHENPKGTAPSCSYCGGADRHDDPISLVDEVPLHASCRPPSTPDDFPDMPDFLRRRKS